MDSRELFYINTPIYYVNDKPHIGHAYATIIADVIARIHRVRGGRVVFVTGTDENSQKTVDAAAKAHEEVVAYTDRLAAQWQDAWKTLHISNTDFIRTTQKRHIETVYEVWKRVEAAGDIYKGSYEGLYCTGCEEFKRPGDLVDGLCPLHKKPPEMIREENYFFRLSKYQSQLLELYKNNPQFVLPTHRFPEVVSFVEAGLEDISISREGKTWGIPVPGDSNHAIYVWFDALINYISAVGLDAWMKHPTDVNVMGKDIVRFHAVIWPAMLLSAGLPVPRQIVTTGFFTIDGQKISKSLGNTIDPLELAATYGNDALRYFLLREIVLGDDGDFSRDKFVGRYNGDLANGLGNFAARVLALAAKQSTLPFAQPTDEVARTVHHTKEAVLTSVSQYRFHEALAAVWELISFGDRMVTETKPWEGEGKPDVIVQLVLILEAIAELLLPFVPDAASAISACIVRNDSTGTFTITKGPVLFPRIS